MFKKLFAILSLSALFSTLSFATDLLAFYTNGKLTEKSPGVKVLSLEEKKSVKGGYIGVPMYGGDWGNYDEYYIVAMPTKQEVLSGNICSLGQSSCSYNPTRLSDYKDIIMGNGLLEFFPVYIVKRQIQYTRYGTPFVVFKYSTAAMGNDTTLYKFNTTTSGLHLNNNIIIKEIANQYKTQMESALGGWSVR